MDAVVRERWRVGDATLSGLAAGRGEPVVLLHGVPTGAELWRDVVARLAGAGFRAVAADLPGYGATTLPPTGDHSLAGAARLLARWLDDAGLAPAWVVGHDTGGAVAQILAADHPQAVARLTLTNSIVDGSWPAPRARVSSLAARAGLYRAAAALRLVPNPYMDLAVRRAFARPELLDPADLRRVFWDTKVRDPRGRAAFERHLAALTPRDTAAVVEALERLDVPCQLVWGMADPYQPWAVAGRRLHRLLAAAAVTRLDGCGHFTPLECPERLVAAMLAWRGAVTA